MPCDAGSQMGVILHLVLQESRGGLEQAASVVYFDMGVQHWEAKSFSYLYLEFVNVSVNWANNLQAIAIVVGLNHKS